MLIHVTFWGGEIVYHNSNNNNNKYGSQIFNLTNNIDIFCLIFALNSLSDVFLLYLTVLKKRKGFLINTLWCR